MLTDAEIDELTRQIKDKGIVIMIIMIIMIKKFLKFRYKIWNKREWTIPFEEGNRNER